VITVPVKRSREILDLLPTDILELAATHAIPRAPEWLYGLHLEAARGQARPQTTAETAALSWSIVLEGDTIRGAIAYRDVFDHTTSSDVREVLYVAGSRRAVGELVDHIRNAGRRVIGTIHLENKPMRRWLQRMNFKPIFVRFEDAA
jgi:hypothetical protein